MELEKRVRWYQGYRSLCWRVDGTYVRVGGKWKYLYRAVDKHRRLIDFMLSDRRFLTKALKVMRMIRRRHCILIEPGVTGEVRFVNKLFDLAA